MDSRAKQRLTGAVILVALFVLLVPELLTGPRKSGGDEPGEEGMRHYTIELDAPAGGSSSAAPAAPAGAVSLPPVAENPKSAAEGRALPGESARPEVAQPESAKPTATATPAPAVAVPMASPPQTVASNPAPASASPQPAASPPKPAVTPSPAHTETARAPVTSDPGARGGYAVQLGSFVSKENAERLVRDMTAKGFSAFLAPPITTGGRELWRVRVGPTRDRASAEALAAQLRRIGQVGSIVSIS